MKILTNIVLCLFFILFYSCSKSSFVSITTNNNWEFYKGIENKLYIESRKNDKIEVSIKNGKLSLLEKGVYLVEINSFGRSEVYVKHKNDTKIDTFYFSNKKVPNVTFTLRLNDGGYVADNQFEIADTVFRKVEKIIPILGSFPHAAYFSVKSYTLVRISKGKVTEIVKNFYEARYAEKGDIYILKNIKLHFSQGDEIISVPDVVYWIK